MSYSDLCNRISEAICQILILDKDQNPVSAGSGVFVEGGYLYSASHVFCDLDNNDKRYGKYTLVRINDYLFNLDGKWSGPIRIHTDKTQLRKIPVDVFMYEPFEIPDLINPLPLASDFVEVGTECIIAGYTDEIDKPLQFDKYFETRNPDMTKVKEEFQDGLQNYFRPCMYKKCMIGSIQPINLNDPINKISIEGREYWTDKHLTYGGSGGPVVNLEGELLGIISRKGLTSASKLGIRSIDQSGVKSVEKLPSGTGLALSHELITDAIDVGLLSAT
jgi:hypothetical protein